MGETAELLSVSEVAALRGCSKQYIQKIAIDGKIECQIIYNERHRPVYQIPVSAISPELQQKYYAQRIEEVRKPETPPSDPFDRFSAAEREEICYWKQLIEEWQGYRAAATTGNRAQVDDQFVLLCKLRGDQGISVNTLYVHWRALRSNDYAALIDKRGKVRKGKSKIDPDIFNAYLRQYLDVRKPPLVQCYKYAEDYARKYKPECMPIPALTTFMRHTLTDVPASVRELGREGEKSYDDRIGPYTVRFYEEIHSNEWWIADNHTFDVIVQRKDGTRYRPYLTAFLDARSGIFTGCHISDGPSSQSTLIALRKGIIRYGIPDNIYTDNGREFLTFDVGGLGHRKRKPKPGEENKHLPPPIFERLGIEMTCAKVRNARAKPIERRFLDVKNQISRLFDTYTGGSVAEKPESLKLNLKAGKIPTEKEFQEDVETLLDWEFNQQPYGGSVARDRDKPRMQVWNEQLKNSQRTVASEEDLNLMMMRSSHMRKLTRDGLILNINGARLVYYDKALTNSQWFGKQVYYRYDPDDLSSVRLYDEEDRYIMTLPMEDKLMAKFADKQEKVKAAMKVIHAVKRETKDMLKHYRIVHMSNDTALKVHLAQASVNREENACPQEHPNILNVRRVDETPMLAPYMTGSTAIRVDLDTMLQNADKN